LKKHQPYCDGNKPTKIDLPSGLVKKSKKKKDEERLDEEDVVEDGEYETIEEALGIDSDVRPVVDVEDKEKPDNIMYFNEVMKTFMVPFVLYVDFEAFIKKTEEDDRHEPSGFCCIRVSSFESMNHEEAYVYSGPDVMQHFYDHVIKERDLVNKILDKQIPMSRMTDTELERYEKATVCGTCDKPFTDKNVKVRHHCHVTGRFIDATCNRCNLQLKPRKSRQIKNYVANEIMDDFFLPVIAHNMRGYDGHLIIKHMGEKLACDDIRVIANNTEKFMTFQVGQLRFLDSLQFLNASLDTLVSNLRRDDSTCFHHTRRHFTDQDSFKRVIRKGVYPYEYMDGPARFEETELPPIAAFHSKLYDGDITDEEYERARDVWSHFGIKNMREYHDLYLKTDTLLLADVFENFRRVAKTNYDLDPCHYYTSPGLSQSACLKFTGVELELFTHIDQLLLIERGIRGGISTICNRYSKANNPYVPGYDPSQPSKYIMYLDANNLYGFSMSEPLPVGKFKFLTEEEIVAFDIYSIGEDDEVGYILDVDLDYPDDTHDIHNDYPLAPESITVSARLHSPYAKRLLEKLGRKPYGDTTKLVPNLRRKRNYVVHYRNLQFYLKQGLVLSKIHQVLRFVQKRWLAPYIAFNTDKRKLATSTFEKDFYKLLNNSMFGKTMENLRKRINVRLVTEQIAAERCVANPDFETFKIINENVTMVKTRVSKIFWNKPTYIGFCVLELSKLLMYQFHYDYILPTYGSNAKLLFTDTDSLCYELTTADAYRDMHEALDRFDTSDYPKDHPNYSPINCKVIGKFKDECNGVAPIEFVGLRSKMYSLLLPDGKEKSTAKGINKNFARKHIKHTLYRDCLFDECTTTASYHQIGSDNHQISTNKIAKSALSPFDDKRYLLEGTTDTLSHGHYRIPVNTEL
jgi:RNase P subunit RPR2